MATVKVKFRASSVATKEGTLFYQVIHKRIVRQIHTGYKLFPAEWDAIHSEVILPSATSESRRDYLLSLKNSLMEDSIRLKNIITRLERSGIAYTSDSLVELYCASTENNGFVSFTLNLIKELNQVGKHRTAETYMTTLNSFIRFRKGKDVLLEEVDSSLMMKYESFLKSTGICPNTTSYYMRNLRAIYNRAVEKGLTVQRSPFKYVYTGIDKTVKRAIPLEEIRRLKELDLTKSPSLAYARDIFMFSFYTRGMSFIDMAYLKKSDLKNGTITYRRRKTGQQLTVKWEKCMEDIIAKYGENTATRYLLPIITNPCSDERTQYRNAICRINVALKEVAGLAGLNIPLTMHVARHCWASVAKSKNIPLSVISEGMGHDSEETTRIYLASLDTSVVDKASSLILKDF
mgnify:CR=1 FL=1